MPFAPQEDVVDGVWSAAGKGDVVVVLEKRGGITAPSVGRNERATLPITQSDRLFDFIRNMTRAHRRGSCRLYSPRGSSSITSFCPDAVALFQEEQPLVATPEHEPSWVAVRAEVPAEAGHAE